MPLVRRHQKVFGKVMNAGTFVIILNEVLDTGHVAAQNLQKCNTRKELWRLNKWTFFKSHMWRMFFFQLQKHSKHENCRFSTRNANIKKDEFHTLLLSERWFSTTCKYSEFPACNMDVEKVELHSRLLNEFWLLRTCENCRFSTRNANVKKDELSFTQNLFSTAKIEVSRGQYV